MSKKVENEKSDSTDASSSEEDMEAESDEGTSTNESQQSQKPFTLSFLQQNKISKQKKIMSYLQNKNNFSSEKKSSLVEKTMTPVPADFTPWWEDIDTTKNSDERTLSKSSKGGDNGLYDSWFDKSSVSTDTNSWLSGPRPTSSIPENVAQVEDIEVPSIYGNMSQPKGRRALKRERKEQRNKTTGKKWFDMKLPDVDGKTKMDMELLQMRRALDPKRFYKQNDRRGLPKYFQLGTVVDEGADFFSSRLTKKQRKQTLVEELMADSKIRQYNKKKYEEIQEKQRSKKFTKKRRT